MLTPRKVKYRKMMRGRSKGKAKRGSTIAFGDFALKALEVGYISARQIEAARRSITRYIKRGGELWIRVFPDKPISKKPTESRMGKGKGSVEYYVAKILPGRIIFELSGVSEKMALAALRLAAGKLSVRTKILKKDEQP